MKEYIISKNDSGQRINKFLEKAVPLLPSSMMHKYFRLKRIKVNGKRSEPAYRLNEGDLVQLYINDEFFEKVKKYVPDSDVKESVFWDNLVEKRRRDLLSVILSD